MNRALLKDILTIFVGLLLCSWSSSMLRTDETDKDFWNRSGASLVIDHGTGCHYLGRLGSVTPRLGADGKQICRKQ